MKISWDNIFKCAVAGFMLCFVVAGASFYVKEKRWTAPQASAHPRQDEWYAARGYVSSHGCTLYDQIDNRKEFDNSTGLVTWKPGFDVFNCPGSIKPRNYFLGKTGGLNVKKLWAFLVGPILILVLALLGSYPICAYLDHLDQQRKHAHDHDYGKRWQAAYDYVTSHKCYVVGSTLTVKRWNHEEGKLIQDPGYNVYECAGVENHIIVELVKPED